MKQRENTFVAFDLTEDDLRAAHSFNSPAALKAWLQTQRSQIAEEKLALEFTPNDVLSYTQQEAYKKGQLDLLSYILQCNEEALNPVA